MRGCCQSLSDDAHEKATGALSKYRMAASRRSTQRLASRAHASLPMTCGDTRQQSVSASRSGMRLPDPAVNAGAPTGTAPCTRPPPRLRWIRHTEVRCGASLGTNPCFGVGPMDVAGPHETIVAEFFPAAAPPRAISRVGPRRTGSSRPLRAKKHAHSGPPLRCGRHGSAARRRP